MSRKEYFDRQASVGEQTGAEEGEPSKKSIAARLILVANCKKYRDQQNQTYIKFLNRETGHSEFHRIDSEATKDFLRYAAYKDLKTKVISRETISVVVDSLKTLARFEGEKIQTAVRVAETVEAGQQTIYYDLSNDAWQVVRCSAGEASIVADSPIGFTRVLAAPQVLPTLGVGREERLKTLREFGSLLGLSRKDWVLFQAVMIAAFKPNIPVPIMVALGGQSTGKSVFTEMIGLLLDPKLANNQLQLKDPRDLIPTAVNSRLLAFDNVSSVPLEMQDYMCTFSTGIAVTQRLLHTNAELVTFKIRALQALTAIVDPLTRDDLSSRKIVIELPKRTDETRITEDELLPMFERMRPNVLGALLTATSFALKKLPTVKLSKYPRLADFAKWVVAAEDELDMEPGEFLRTYEENRIEDINTRNAVDPLVQALSDLIPNERTLGELKNAEMKALEVEAESPVTTNNVVAARKLHELNQKHQGLHLSAARLFSLLQDSACISPHIKPLLPSTPAHLSGELRRKESSLLLAGIRIEFPQRTSGRVKPIVITSAHNTQENE